MKIEKFYSQACSTNSHLYAQHENISEFLRLMKSNASLNNIDYPMQYYKNSMIIILKSYSLDQVKANVNVETREFIWNLNTVSKVSYIEIDFKFSFMHMQYFIM
jgi:hypothetical protein